MIPKPKRIIDRKYLKWVKTKPCLFSHRLINIDELPRDACIGPIDPHHATPKSIGGSDYTAVPLCRKHHDRFQSDNLAWPWFISEAKELYSQYRKEVGVKRERPPTLKSREQVQLEKQDREVKRLRARLRKAENKLQQMKGYL